MWSRLIEHRDVTSQTEPDQDPSPASNEVVEADQVVDESLQEGKQSAFLRSHATTRLHTTEERIWIALTGHSADWRRVPKSEFQCLAVIAAAGPNGVLQPDVTTFTGQDKRSVPKRTDALHQKGYIVKESCLGGGSKTSLLRLKRFVTSEESTAYHQVDSNATRVETHDKPLTLIRYDQWFDDLIRLLKDHDGIMTVDDLRFKFVRSDPSKWQTRH